ncbi:MAG: DUF6067 family protein [Agriterribacter sp.]
MKKVLVIFCIIITTRLCAQDISYSDTGKTIYTDPYIASKSKANTGAWAKMTKPIEVSFAASDIRYPKDEVPVKGIEQQWKAVAWKGEKVHTQLLLWTKQPLSTVTYKASDIVNKKGEKITAQNITASFVRYVITDEFAGGCGYRTPDKFDSSVVEDVIDITPTLDVKANTVQPVWLSVKVPQDATPGLYSGTITITADKPYTLPYTILVKDRILPDASEWAFDLDLWQHPAAIARIHNVPLWSNKHFEYMKGYYTMLAQAGQKCITTSIMNEPWGHQTYDDFPGLIKWTKRSDGSWSYDYSLFDKYVQFVMDCGIRKRINCYSMVPWALSFAYYDEAAKKDTTLKAAIGSAEYNLHWTNMLRSFTQHLKEKGWFEISTIAMDERPMKDMQIVISILKTIDPKWKVALAGNYHPQIEKYIYDYCLASNLSFPPAVLQKRLQEGKPSTYYTCCSEPYPNGFTFSPPDEHVWIGWYAAAKGFTGYLRWAYNSWVASPLQDSRFRTWPAGDTYQVYPGPRSSIRFEKLTEGIQDFEKIRILKEELTKKGDAASLQKLNQLLQTFDIQKLKTVPATNMIVESKQKLNEW